MYINSWLRHIYFFVRVKGKQIVWEAEKICFQETERHVAWETYLSSKHFLWYYYFYFTYYVSLIHLDEERILYFKGLLVVPNLQLTFKSFKELKTHLTDICEFCGQYLPE